MVMDIAEREILKGLSPIAQATRVFGTAHPSLQLLALTDRVEKLERIIKEMLKPIETPIKARTISKDEVQTTGVKVKMSVDERMARARAAKKAKKK